MTIRPPLPRPPGPQRPSLSGHLRTVLPMLRARGSEGPRLSRVHPQREGSIAPRPLASSCVLHIEVPTGSCTPSPYPPCLAACVNASEKVVVSSSDLCPGDWRGPTGQVSSSEGPPRSPVRGDGPGNQPPAGTARQPRDSLQPWAPGLLAFLPRSPAPTSSDPLSSTQMGPSLPVPVHGPPGLSPGSLLGSARHPGPPPLSRLPTETPRRAMLDHAVPRPSAPLPSACLEGVPRPVFVSCVYVSVVSRLACEPPGQGPLFESVFHVHPWVR